jgi:3D (Asp-Asp-Asp) domain-containing protein
MCKFDDLVSINAHDVSVIKWGTKLFIKHMQYYEMIDYHGGNIDIIYAHNLEY